MSYDRVSLNSASFGGEQHRKPAAKSSGDKSAGLGSESLALGASAAAANGLQYGITGNPLMQKWGDNFTAWSTRTALADMADNMISKKRLPPGTPRSAAPQVAPGSVHSYSNLLKMGDKSVALNKFNLSDFKSTVKSNLSEVGKQPGGLLREGTTLKSYLKNTVVGENVKPIKELFTKGADGKFFGADKKIGAGVGRAAGLAYMATSVFKEGKAAYQQAKAQEDGSFGSKLKTFASTGVAVVKEAAKSAISWEAAGAAFAIGKAILPIAAGGIPLGGILIGALGGALVNTALDKAAPGVAPEEEGASPTPFSARA